jgi:hypothetical protein
MVFIWHPSGMPRKACTNVKSQAVRFTLKVVWDCMTWRNALTLAAYFLDEPRDMSLLHNSAAARRFRSTEMIGAVSDIDPDTLPNRWSGLP